MLAAISLGGLLSSCGGSSSSPRISASSSIKSIEIGQSLKTATSAFSFISEGDSCFLTKNVSIQWPQKVGGADLAPLQDSILAIALGSGTSSSIDSAITSYLKEYKEVADSAVAIAPDKVPLSTRAYTSSVSVRTLETTPLYTTSQITSSSYLGGAHAMTTIRPLSYALDSAKVITLDNLFKADDLPKVKQIVAENLASQLNVGVDNLTSAGLFTNDIPLSSNVYIINSTLVFHYGQYEIAPYSMGMFDVDVYPYTVREYLTPLGASLFPTQLN